MLSIKRTKRIVLLLLAAVLIFMSGINMSAAEASFNSAKEKASTDKIYEKYQISDLPSAIVKSVNSTGKTPIEIVNHETDDMYSVTVKNDDGTNTLHVFQTPIKYEEDNVIKIKKDTITDSSENISLFKNYAFESVNNEIKGFYPKDISDGIKVEYDDYEVKLAPFSEKAKSILILDDADKAVKAENSISYADVFGSNISLEYSSTLNGIKENIIIEKYDGKNTFDFIIETNGLLPEKMEGDSIPLLDPETGEMKLYIGQINAKDSYVGNNENDEVHFTLFNSLKLEKIAESQYKLTVIVDKDFLESETTVYPVIVDPTISIGTSNMADAPVYSGYPSTNYYTNDYNMVGYHGSSYQEAITYVKLNTLSSYKYINPAKIGSVYYNVYEGSGRTSSATINVRGAASEWTDSAITYSNRPGLSSPVSSLTISSSGWYNFNITTLFKNWLKHELKESELNANYGFALAASTTGVSSRHFCSANNTNYPPSIIVNYSEDTSIAEGAYFIKSKYSNLYLDTEQDASANGNVIQYTFHGNENQVWVVKYQGSGYYKLYSSWYDEDKCLDVETQPTQNGSNVDVFEDSSNADWLLFKLVSNNDGTYRIISKWSDNQKVLDVCGPSKQPTANIQIWEYMGVNQQKWIFEPIKPTIVSREAWGAEAFTPNGGDTGEIIIDGQVILNPTHEQLKTFYNMIVVHHTTRPGNESMLVLQSSQTDDYADVGYHFVIDASGTIYEGREINKNGAHVGGQNSGKIGVALMGHFDPSWDPNAESTRPTEAQIVSLQRLNAWLNYEYEIDSVKKHKDLDSSTICPGQYAEEDLAGRFIFR